MGGGGGGLQTSDLMKGLLHDEPSLKKRAIIIKARQTTQQSMQVHEILCKCSPSLEQKTEHYLNWDIKLSYHCHINLFQG